MTKPKQTANAKRLGHLPVKYMNVWHVLVNGWGSPRNETKKRNWCGFFRGVFFRGQGVLLWCLEVFFWYFFLGSELLDQQFFKMSYLTTSTLKIVSFEMLKPHFYFSHALSNAIFTNISKNIPFWDLAISRIYLSINGDFRRWFRSSNKLTPHHGWMSRIGSERLHG